MAINSKGSCNNCKANSPSTDDLEPIGKPVIIASAKEQTQHEFFQCTKCGSVLVKYVDSGLGGHGRFWKNITQSLY